MVLMCIMFIVFPLLLGTGISIIIGEKHSDNTVSLWEAYLCGFMGSIGIFEIGHLPGVFLGLPISVCGKIIVGVMAASCVLAVSFSVFRYRKKLAGSIRLERGKIGVQCVPVVVFLLVLAAQIYYICRTPMLQTSGDIMLETINSFLVTDEIYSVSPLTGKAYLGAPLRYEILCLPTVYTLLSEWFGIAPEMLIDNVIPVAVLCVTYMAYYLLSGTLFGKDKNNAEKRLWFMVIVAAIFFLCEKMFYMDGYGLLHAGHLGTTIRNSILVPVMLYAVLGKKRGTAILCVLTEACIVWTFWGFGVCAVILAGMFVVGIVCKNKL